MIVGLSNGSKKYTLGGSQQWNTGFWEENWVLVLSILEDYFEEEEEKKKKKEKAQEDKEEMKEDEKKKKGLEEEEEKEKV